MNAKTSLGALVSLFLVALGAATGTQGCGQSVASCGSICGLADSPGACATQCEENQVACSATGYGAEFQAYLTCIDNAGTYASVTGICATVAQTMTNDCSDSHITPPVDGGTPSPDGSTPIVDSGAPDVLSPFCPSSPPVAGTSCSEPQSYCEYGTDPNPDCNTLWFCDEGAAWQDETTSGICAPPDAACPGFSVDTNDACPVDGQTCAYPEGTCVCTTDPGGLPEVGGPIWACVPTTAGCPVTRPTLGTSCDVSDELDCDYGQCIGGAGESCVNGAWNMALVACAG
jgi:hypothetical protein